MFGSRRTTRLAVAVATVSLVAPFIGAQSASAIGTGKPCVSKAEYHLVNHTMKRKHVHFIFDTVGKQTFHATSSLGNRYESRAYKTCTKPKIGFVRADYVNGVLSDKTAYWG
jgi:hypothetical protein